MVRFGWKAVALLSICALALVGRAGAAPAKEQAPRVRVLRGGLPEKSTIPPMASIPVEPLGFTAPGALYLGERVSLVSLDFLDENHLLFSFRVPGLLHRDQEQDKGSEVRQVRAVVLELSSGVAVTETVWTLHDRARYLWALGDGHFLLRNGAEVFEGDAELNLKPLLHFPGAVFSLEMDPGERYMVANSYEPESERDSGVPAQDWVIRILERATGRVLLVSRIAGAQRLPINSEGYLDLRRGTGLNWELGLHLYTGGSRVWGTLASNCMPGFDFNTDTMLVASGCAVDGARLLMGVTTEGKLLWQDAEPETSVWPVRRRSANGARLLEQTLVASHAVGVYAPLGQDDIKGQAVRVFDAASGAMVFETAANPVFDAGGNAALSPGGGRLAVLAGGAIQIYELPIPAQNTPPEMAPAAPRK